MNTSQLIKQVKSARKTFKTIEKAVIKFRAGYEKEDKKQKQQREKLSAAIEALRTSIPPLPEGATDDVATAKKRKKNDATIDKFQKKLDDLEEAGRFEDSDLDAKLGYDGDDAQESVLGSLNLVQMDMDDLAANLDQLAKEIKKFG